MTKAEMRVKLAEIANEIERIAHVIADGKKALNQLRQQQHAMKKALREPEAVK